MHWFFCFLFFLIINGQILFSILISQYSSNVHFMWRLAKAHFLASDIATKNGDDATKKKLVFEGEIIINMQLL